MHAERDFFHITGANATTHIHHHEGPSWVGVLHPLNTRPKRVSAVDTPSRLLSVRAGLVPYTGREEQLAELHRWRVDDSVDASVKLVYGPGGRGKTRLGVEFAKTASADGWSAWDARIGDHGQGKPVPPPPDGCGHVVLVDYAERWPVDTLIGFIEDLTTRCAGTPLRILLLARYSPWFAAVGSRLFDSPTVDVDVASDMLLAAVDDADTYRHELYTRAVTAFAEVEPYRGNVDLKDVTPPEYLVGDGAYGLELTVLMAALAAVDSRYRGETRPSAARLSRYLLDRELRHWSEHARWNRLGVDAVAENAERLAKTVYCATLIGRRERGPALRVLTISKVADDEVGAQRALREHAEFYPPDPGELLAPLLPDRLGEDYLALATPGIADGTTPVSSADLSAWTVTAFPTSSGSGWLSTFLIEDAAPTSSARQTMTMLVEAAGRWPHLVPYLRSLLHRHPELALSAGSTILAAVADLFADDLETLVVVESIVPQHSHAELDVGKAVLAVNLVRLLPHDGDEASAVRLWFLSGRLAEAGRFQESLEAAEKAVAVYRRLAASDPKRYEPGLAGCLESLGHALHNMARHAEAVEFFEQAVEIYTRLVAAYPGRHTAALANSLNQVGTQLGEIGRISEGLAVFQRAVDLLSPLSDNAPDVEERLAEVLNNQSVYLALSGDENGAFVAVRRATEVYERSARSEPERYLPRLSNTLNNLGLRLYRKGRADEGLDVLLKAVDIRDRLVSLNPRRYERELTESLAHVALVGAATRRVDVALQAGERAVKLCEPRFRVDPVYFGRPLVMALNGYGCALAAHGRHDDAARAADAAAAVCVQLSRTDPSHEPDMAAAFTTLSTRLVDGGRYAEALHVAEHAVEMYGRLEARDPSRFAVDRVKALHGMSRALVALGEFDEAMRTNLDAVAVYRRLAERDPVAHRPGLAGSLGRAGLTAFHAKTPDALLLLDEAVTLYERLDERHRGEFDDKLTALKSHLETLRDRTGT